VWYGAFCLGLATLVLAGCNYDRTPNFAVEAPRFRVLPDYRQRIVAWTKRYYVEPDSVRFLAITEPIPVLVLGGCRSLSRCVGRCRFGSSAWNSMLANAAVLTWDRGASRSALARGSSQPRWSAAKLTRTTTSTCRTTIAMHGSSPGVNGAATRPRPHAEDTGGANNKARPCAPPRRSCRSGCMRRLAREPSLIANRKAGPTAFPLAAQSAAPQRTP
jgi:hypothetical protein